MNERGCEKNQVENQKQSAKEQVMKKKGELKERDRDWDMVAK